MSPKDADFVASLQSQIDALQTRVKELEAENAKLLSQLTDCSNHEMEKKLHGSDDKHVKSKKGNTETDEKIHKMPGYHSMLIKHRKRYVALKVMYFGKRFYGFSSEAQMDPTVESEIFKAIEKTRLLVGDKKESQYSRCGRTDKGVSSVGQVIVFLKINLKVSGTNNRKLEKFFQRSHMKGKLIMCKRCRNGDNQEKYGSRELLFCHMAYLKIPNPAPEGVHNYRRHITFFEMSPTNVSYDDNQLWVMKIKGTAFLWHQVRCMVAVLFMVGKGLESPDVIDILLDTNRTPRKPQYIMAAEFPLVLQSCEFEEIRFMCSSGISEALRLHLVNECQTYQLQAAIFHEAILNCLSTSDDQSLQHYGGTKKKASHVPLLSRPTEPSYEERRAKFNST
ncbi:tRNA pseudouridine(38/39) synthase [Neltuma alba]|uniref:tRNA pseudouridine(38/39) synthase n=1 Tax=Neltuma alba TaxID=207710 RepID=UPI0010A44D77|nr:tRNA pseudouridine(38/39) synthase [Prosopis alba]